jgi:integrase
MKGSMRERSPGVWQLRVGAGRNEDGGYKVATRTVHGTRAMAERALKRLQREVAAERPAAVRNVGWLLDAHLANLEALGRSPTTIRAYRSNLRHLEPIRPILVERLGASDLDAVYRTMATAGLATSSIRQVHAIMRGALRQAMKWDLVDRNVATLATLPSLHQREIVPPTLAQVRALLLKAAEDPMLGTFVWLAATTGARRGELCGLKWSDLDVVPAADDHPETATLTIRRAVIDAPGGGVIVKDTKSHAVRALAVDEAVLAALTAWQATAVAPLVEAGVTTPPWVFSIDGVNPVRPEWVTAAYRRLTKQAGTPGIRFHDLRHFVATSAMQQGVDLRTIAGRLGHAGGGAVTLKVYAHAIAERDREFADTHGKALRA